MILAPIVNDAGPREIKASKPAALTAQMICGKQSTQSMALEITDKRGCGLLQDGVGWDTDGFDSTCLDTPVTSGPGQRPAQTWNGRYAPGAILPAALVHLAMILFQVLGGFSNTVCSLP